MHDRQSFLKKNSLDLQLKVRRNYLFPQTECRHLSLLPSGQSGQSLVTLGLQRRKNYIRAREKEKALKKIKQVTLKKTYVASDEAADGECGVGLGLDAGLGVNVGDVDLKDKA